MPHGVQIDAFISFWLIETHWKFNGNNQTGVWLNRWPHTQLPFALKQHGSFTFLNHMILLVPPGAAITALQLLARLVQGKALIRRRNDGVGLCRMPTIRILAA